MKKYQVIILGAGASGAYCALSTQSKSVALIDASNRVAKKILATGNGRCNLTNLNVSSKFYNTDVDAFFARYSNKNTVEEFSQIGLETYSDEEGRVYPISNSAKSVMDILNKNLEDKVELFLDNKIVSVRKIENGFCVETDKEFFECDKLVVALGGNSSKILNDLGVDYKPFVPSLVALRSNVNFSLNNIKVSNVVVTATNSFGEIAKEKGEVLFKENALSGIVMFNLSTLFARRNDFSGEVSIDLLPDYTESQLYQNFAKRKINNKTTESFFVGMFQNALGFEIFKRAGIKIEENTNNLSQNDLTKIVDVVKNFKFIVTGSGDNNQVYSGGVKLDSLNQNLMSKNVDGLYFCGEIVDVDGVCGGYNLQWAWTSGKLVGESII